MKHQSRRINLTELQKESIGLLYFNVKNAVEICEAMQSDKELDGYVKYNFFRMWNINFKKIKDQLDRSLGCNEHFDEQVKNTDTLGLHQIIQTYLSLTPDKRYALEQLFEAIQSDQELNLEVV